MNLKQYTTIARVSFQNAIAYRTNILSKFAFYTLFIYVFMCLWRTIYQEGSIEGFSYVQIVWYLIITELIAFGFRTNIYSKINDDVRDGSIVYSVNRPVNFVFFQLSNALGEMGLNVVLFSVLAGGLGLLFVGPLPSFSWPTLPLVGLSMLLGLFINFFFYMLIGLSAFVMEDNFSIFLIYQKLTFMLGTFIPVEFLPSWLQGVARNLPFSYVSWAPARLFVDFSFPLFWQMISRQALWLAVILALTLLAFRGAMKRINTNGG